MSHVSDSIMSESSSMPSAIEDTVWVGWSEGATTQFLARSAVSKLLGVSPNTVTRWAREGRLPSQLTLGGHHRFNREFIEQLRMRLYRAGGLFLLK